MLWRQILTNTRIFTIGIALLLGACSFNSDVEQALSGGSTGLTEDDETGTGDTGADTETYGTEGTGMASGDTGTASDDTETDSDSEGPMENPAPNEPCDPILAFEGVAPCEDPDAPQTPYTCAPTKLMPNPNETIWEFRCIAVKDTQGNGSDLGDGCGDDGGQWSNNSTPAGCFNSWCLWNGLGNNPDLDEHVNWPANECSFGSADTYYVKGCCSPYCDAETPCDSGWTCTPLTQQGINIETDVGSCVWNG